MRAPAETLDRDAFAVEFEDDFDAATLDEAHWLPHYLPQWSTPDRSAARYEIRDSVLRLLIEADTPPWCPELDGDLRVSSIQTGVFAGPPGSSVGQLQFHTDVIVRTPQRDRALVAPRYGLVEARMRALGDPRLMVALWMIGLEDTPERSSEICVAEIFGRDVRAGGARVGMGLHPWADPTITDDFLQEDLAIDIRDWHTYAADWTDQRVAWYVDDRLVRVVEQSPTYPQQLMLGVYEFPIDGDERPAADYPKTFEVDHVRVSQRRR
jgi:hypothetical protein